MSVPTAAHKAAHGEVPRPADYRLRGEKYVVHAATTR